MLTSRLREHVCAACRSERLRFIKAGLDSQDGIEDGSLTCEACGATYTVVGGIPRFVPASNYADSFGFQWNTHARTQLDSHSGLPISSNRLWEALGGAAELTGERVLEAGSGAGRFTEVLASTGADVVTFDYSTAVDANARNRIGSRNVHIFQGDIFNIPLAEASFDTVICLGVLQHTPRPREAFCSLAKFVKPGGRLAIDVYRKDIAALLQWKYVLRPITRRMRKERLYRLIQAATPPLVPIAKLLRRVAGRLGARLVPIVEYSHLGLPDALNVQWAILDTFDMYSPAHDHPQSVDTVMNWFQEIGFTEIRVWRGANGVVGTGRRPLAAV